MSRQLPEGEYGPNFQFREYSFLEDAQAAPLNASTLTVTICKVCGWVGWVVGREGVGGG